MILIADSGSTNTDWALITPSGEVERQTTPGINPFFQTGDEIFASISKEVTLQVKGVHQVFFYGAGCANDEKRELVRNAIVRAWQVSRVFVDSDLMAAARSLCQRQRGIAAILGTGSNSCFYDGITIVNHVSPLGYVLGDEGSAAVLGRKLVADVLKKQLPESVCRRFWDFYRSTPADILDRVYKQPFPNRFLAGFAHFIHQNIYDESLRRLVRGSFVEFFERNISQYESAIEQPVNFTGSTAWYFSELLHEAAEISGFRVGTICQNPMDGLVAFHIGATPGIK
ncbi:hypothetical protein [Alkaliflexus imshenetskii]|uniref:hypothetical protein n=1 Tax=Alkaliflexus imshenetskii TaxID=286730 RepID=UPI00047A0C5B|nr:hypothetical protein [Alkaliflexus imshenetskii]